MVNTTKPVPIPDPIYINKFSVSAKDNNGNTFGTINKQFSKFSVINEDSNLPLLEIILEVNEGLLYDLLNESINTKSLIITYEDRKNKPTFNVEFNVLYRGFSGIEGSYGDPDIMRLKIYYQIQSQVLIENDRKLRLR